MLKWQQAIIASDNLDSEQPTGYYLNQWWLNELMINSLAPGKFEWIFRFVIIQGILVIDGWAIFCEIALIWMSVDFTDDQSTLVQVMAWCRRATSHYLSQCWPRTLTPYGVTRPQWVKTSHLFTVHARVNRNRWKLTKIMFRKITIWKWLAQSYIIKRVLCEYNMTNRNSVSVHVIRNFRCNFIKNVVIVQVHSYPTLRWNTIKPPV